MAPLGRLSTRQTATHRGGRGGLVAYLGTVLGFGHRHQELEDGLGLRHQWRDGMDDRRELRKRSAA